MSRHLKCKGVSKVVLTAPASGPGVTTVIAGVNNDRIEDDTQLYSAASCTTNAIAPVLKAVQDAFGIRSGHIETVHSFTNDQNLIDNFHKKSRRGRSAVLNMVITETGTPAARSAPAPAPGLTPLPPPTTTTLSSHRRGEGRERGASRAGRQAHRQRHPRSHARRFAGHNVPGTHGTPPPAPGSPPPPPHPLRRALACTQRPVSAEEANKLLLERSLRGQLQNQVDYYSSPDLVSSDCVGNRHASIVDSQATLAHGTPVAGAGGAIPHVGAALAGNRINLYVWYDNEFGYSCQVIRLVQQICGIVPTMCPTDHASKMVVSAK